MSVELFITTSFSPTSGSTTRKSTWEIGGSYAVRACSFFQVLFGPRPILFRRSDGTTPLQPMQVSTAGDTHVVGTHRGGSFAWSAAGGWLVQAPRLCGHEPSDSVFHSKQWRRVLSVRTRETAKETEGRYRLPASNCGLSAPIIGQSNLKVKFY
jgi:hypothetical protein